MCLFALKIFQLFILLLRKVKLRLGCKASVHYPLRVLQWVLGPISFRLTGFDLDIGHLFLCILCIGRQNTNTAGIQTDIWHQGSIQRSSAVIKIP